MQRYEKYKDSGVEWIGEIPEGWEVGLLKRYSGVTDGSHFSPKSQLIGWPYVSVKDVGVNCIDLNSCNKISEDDFLSLVNNGCSPMPGDVLLTKDGTIGRAAVVTEEYKQFVVLSSLGILTPKNKLHSNFLYLYLISGINIDQMYSTIHGSALTRLTIEKINNLIFVCPPKQEQTTIANYLDRKTAEIDQLIAQKERLVALYEEEKTALINQAVTQGINPKATLKESGIDWMGKIPEGWEVKKARYVTSYFKGNAFKSSDFRRKGIPIVKATNIKNKIIVNITSFIGLKNQKNEFERVRLKEGDLIISTVGSKPEVSASAVGQLASIDASFSNSYLNQNTLCIRPTSLIFANYLKHSFFSKYTRSRFDASALWIANQAYLEVESIRNIELPIPPLGEQIAIVQHIETETTRINTKITQTKKIIALQKEYRTALISEVVTGKVKVT